VLGTVLDVREHAEDLRNGSRDLTFDHYRRHRVISLPNRSPG
jgi:hypothetical protein